MKRKNELPIQDRARAALTTEKERMLYDAFGIVALDKEEMSVEYAVSAQREVVFRDEA